MVPDPAEWREPIAVCVPASCVAVFPAMRNEASGPAPRAAGPAVVVGAAILDDDRRLLAAQRAAPAALAGRWELPGGKVEAGEDDRDALCRECEEELGVHVRLGARVGGDWPIGPNGILRVWFAEITEGEPRPLEHAALRWLTPDQIEDLPWLPADLPLVREIAVRLLAGTL